MCFEAVFGDDGKGGNEVRFGDTESVGESGSAISSWPSPGPAFSGYPDICERAELLGDGDLLLGSVDDVMALLTGEAVSGVATECVRSLAMTPAFLICPQLRPSMPPPLDSLNRPVQLHATPA